MFALSLISLLTAAPAGILAFRLPENIPSNCTVTTTLPSKTVTDVFPTSFITGNESIGHPVTTKIIYTTVLPTLGPGGVEPCTYTITVPCPGTPGSPCHKPESAMYPPGFSTKTTLCHYCGPTPVTVTVAIPPDCETGIPNPPAQETEVSKSPTHKAGKPELPTSEVDKPEPTIVATAIKSGLFHETSSPPDNTGVVVVPTLPLDLTATEGLPSETPSVVQVVGSGSNIQLGEAWMAAIPIVVAFMGF